MNKKQIGYYDYTVILTYLGLLSACFGIFLVIGEQFHMAILCLIISGVCDMFDGTVAATKKRTPNEKSFGIQIDSLSDLVSFGVLPAVFVYTLSGKMAVCGMICALYILSALIRLAYFNVTEAERQKQTAACRKSYLGMPVTMISIFLPIAFVLYQKHIFVTEHTFIALLLLTGCAFLTPIEVRKPQIIKKLFAPFLHEDTPTIKVTFFKK